MAKSTAAQPKASRRTATKAFEHAWKLLGQLEKRLAAARAEESKRRRQLLEATGDEIAHRQEQLDAALANAREAAALLTELSEMIAANARAKASQTVSTVAHEAAAAVRDEARAKTAAQAASAATPAAARPPAAPRKRAVAVRTKVPADAPPSQPVKAAPSPAKPVARRTRTASSATPTTRKPAIKRATTTARPRARRSLQPDDRDPGQSSS
jgi:hypothetical protein